MCRIFVGGTRSGPGRLVTAGAAVVDEFDFLDQRFTLWLVGQRLPALLDLAASPGIDGNLVLRRDLQHAIGKFGGAGPCRIVNGISQLVRQVVQFGLLITIIANSRVQKTQIRSQVFGFSQETGGILQLAGSGQLFGIGDQIANLLHFISAAIPDFAPVQQLDGRSGP